MHTPPDPPIDVAAETDAGVIRSVVNAAKHGLVDRDVLVEVLVLAAIAGEHVLVVGPPGTAKSEAVRRVAGHLGGSYFEYLLGRFTEPNEIFGPVDIRRLRDGIVEVETAGMLPEAEVAFLDEVFLGSTAILNTLLGMLNEGVYRRGSTLKNCPLRLCVGASNSLPDDPALAAFADRFLVRVFVDQISDSRLEDLLDVGWRSGTRRGAVPGQVDDSDHSAGPVGSIATIDRLRATAASMDLSPIQPVIGTAIRRLRGAGIAITDRRAVHAQSLVAAAAAVAGRSTATVADLWPLPLIARTADAQVLARETLDDLLANSDSSALPFAAEELSLGPAARASRIESDCRALAESVSVEPGVPLGRDDRLRFEAVLREIDAGFGPEDLPPNLVPVRAWLVGAVQS